MRRVILAEALTGSALHFFCGGTSILVDGFSAGEGIPFPLSQNVITALAERRGKYSGLRLSLTTETAESASFPVFEEEYGFPKAEREVYVDPFWVQRFSAGSCFIYRISVDDYSIVVLGPEKGEALLFALQELPRSQSLFLPEELFFGREGLPLTLQSGATSVFITRMQEVNGHLIHKRIQRFQKKGLRVRLLDKTPSGFML